MATACIARLRQWAKHWLDDLAQRLAEPYNAPPDPQPPARLRLSATRRRQRTARALTMNGTDSLSARS